MKKNEAIEAAKHYFDTKPALKEIFITGDGQAFEAEGNAVNHAKSLTDKEVVTVLREDEIDNGAVDNGELKDAAVAEVAKEEVKVDDTIEIPADTVKSKSKK